MEIFKSLSFSDIPDKRSVNEEEDLPSVLG